jgi:thioredoxin 1
MSKPTRAVVLAFLAFAIAVVFALKRNNPTADDTRPVAGAASSLPSSSPASGAAEGDTPATSPTSAPRADVPSTVVAAIDRPTDAPSAVHARTVAASLPRLLDIGADKCIPCKAMAPILEELRREYEGRLRVEFIDAWKHPEQAEPYNVYGIPVQIFFDASGREVHRHLGFISKEDILATWRSLGYPLAPKG